MLPDLSHLSFYFLSIQGAVNTLSDLRRAEGAYQRLSAALEATEADASLTAAMAGVTAHPLASSPWKRPAKAWAPAGAAAGDPQAALAPGARSAGGSAADHSVNAARTFTAASSSGSGAAAVASSAGRAHAASSFAQRSGQTAVLTPPCSEPPSDSSASSDAGGAACSTVDLADPLAAVTAANSGGALQLSLASFAYPGRPEARVLQDVSLTLRPGTLTALVGRSGAGKSTIGSLLARFYEPSSGHLTLGGIPAACFTTVQWSHAVALVSQDPVLFSGTIAGLPPTPLLPAAIAALPPHCICSCWPQLAPSGHAWQPPCRFEALAHHCANHPNEPLMLDRCHCCLLNTLPENIGYGKGGFASQAEIEAAARAANAHDFITSLPKAYNTLVGDRGALLSGAPGSAQR